MAPQHDSRFPVWVNVYSNQTDKQDRAIKESYFFRGWNDTNWEKKKKNLIQQENGGYLYCNKKQLEIGSECVGKIFIKPKEVCKQSSKSQSYLIWEEREQAVKTNTHEALENTW